ncbi:MAG: DMT family transporter [Candidatus Acetothermia bacterium]|jgi:drug/metabolite transporter (DMT)-like permease|nr:DMT family transporter [Candidatus Acetothermia bacterium]MDH7505464.1 DMT family transporter [Candidatus Acetothermia bacterium]
MGSFRGRVYVVLLGGICIISFGSILIKLIPAPALTIAAYRLALATLLLAPFAWRRRAEWRPLSGRDLALSLLSGVFLALHFLTWISSLKYTSVASSVVLVSSSPIFVGLGTHFILRERLGAVLVSAVAVSLLGALLIGYSDLSFGMEELQGDLLALAGAMMVSGYFLIGRYVRQRVGLFNYIFIVYGLAGLLLVLLALVARQPLSGYPGSAYLFLFLLALGPQALGHSSLNWALRYVSAATIAVVTLGEPVGAAILAYFILHEGLTPLKLCGGLLILGGIYLASRAGVME